MIQQSSLPFLKQQTHQCVCPSQTPAVTAQSHLYPPLTYQCHLVSFLSSRVVFVAVCCSVLPQRQLHFSHGEMLKRVGQCRSPKGLKPRFPPGFRGTVLLNTRLPHSLQRGRAEAWSPTVWGPWSGCMLTHAVQCPLASPVLPFPPGAALHMLLLPLLPQDPGKLTRIPVLSEVQRGLGKGARDPECSSLSIATALLCSYGFWDASAIRQLSPVPPQPAFVLRIGGLSCSSQGRCLHLRC